MAKDKVKLYDDERLDIPDATALQDLIYEYLDRALGGLIGLGQGMVICETFLTKVPATYTYTLDDCLIYQCTDAGITGDGTYVKTEVTKNGSITRKGRFVRHDKTYLPSLTIDFTPLLTVVGPDVTECIPAVIFAKIATISTDTDTRRKWDTVTGAEITFVNTTRTRQYISELRVVSYQNVPAGAPQPPDNLGDWCAIGTVEFSSGMVSDNLLIKPIWAFGYYQTIGALPVVDVNTGLKPLYLQKSERVWAATTMDWLTLNYPDQGYNEFVTSVVEPILGLEDQTVTDPKFLGDTSTAFHPDTPSCTAQLGSHGIAHQMHLLRLQLARMNYWDADSTSDFYRYPDDWYQDSEDSNLKPRTRWADLPPTNLRALADTVGTAEEAHAAWTYNPLGTGKGRLIPLYNHPRRAYKNPTQTEQFRYGNLYVEGFPTPAGFPASSNMIGAGAKVKNAEGMGIVSWHWQMYTDASYTKGDVGLIVIQGTLDVPPQVKDASGGTQNIRFTNMTFTTNPFINDTHTGLMQPIRIHNWYWCFGAWNAVSRTSPYHYVTNSTKAAATWNLIAQFNSNPDQTSTPQYSDISFIITVDAELTKDAVTAP